MHMLLMQDTTHIDKPQIAIVCESHVFHTWTGDIDPVARWSTDQRGVTVRVRIAPYDKVVIALDGATQPIAVSIESRSIRGKGSRPRHPSGNARSWHRLAFRR